jgi:hypothetical protein
MDGSHYLHPRRHQPTTLIKTLIIPGPRHTRIPLFPCQEMGNPNPLPLPLQPRLPRKGQHPTRIIPKVTQQTILQQLAQPICQNRHRGNNKAILHPLNKENPILSTKMPQITSYKSPNHHETICLIFSISNPSTISTIITLRLINCK